MAEPDVVSIAVNVNLRVPPSPSSIALGRGAGSFSLKVSLIQNQLGIETTRKGQWSTEWDERSTHV